MRRYLQRIDSASFYLEANIYNLLDKLYFLIYNFRKKLYFAKIATPSRAKQSL